MIFSVNSDILFYDVFEKQIGQPGYRLIRQRRKEFRIMKVIATVLWGITALYLYKNLNQIFQPGSWADLAWKKAPVPVRQWRE